MDLFNTKYFCFHFWQLEIQHMWHDKPLTFTMKLTTPSPMHASFRRILKLWPKLQSCKLSSGKPESNINSWAFLLEGDGCLRAFCLVGYCFRFFFNNKSRSVSLTEKGCDQQLHQNLLSKHWDRVNLLRVLTWLHRGPLFWADQINDYCIVWHCLPLYFWTAEHPFHTCKTEVSSVK